MQEGWKNYELEGVEPIANHHLLVEYQVRFLTNSAFLVDVCFHYVHIFDKLLKDLHSVSNHSHPSNTSNYREDNCGVTLTDHPSS